MGNILSFPLAENAKEFFPPVDSYDSKDCVLLTYSDLPGIVGLMVAYGPELEEGFHAVEIPDALGWVIRLIQIAPDGLILYNPAALTHSHIYRTGEVKIIGRVIQFIRDWETGERWELLTGHAVRGRVPMIPLLSAQKP